MHDTMLLIFILLLSSIIHVNSYGCSCSCCTGSGCSLVYLGGINVHTCASTTCFDTCKASYTTCSIGSVNAVCSATNIFKFYKTSSLIVFTLIIILILNQ
ncbi:unnamed protein product [Adineta steineri]|nr:unnamed protein product [Adineta steineri]